MTQTIVLKVVESKQKKLKSFFNLFENYLIMQMFFDDLTLFQRLGQNSLQKFRWVLVDLKALKGHFEIKWPLRSFKWFLGKPRCNMILFTEACYIMVYIHAFKKNRRRDKHKVFVYFSGFMCGSNKRNTSFNCILLLNIDFYFFSLPFQFL